MSFVFYLRTYMPYVSLYLRWLHGLSLRVLERKCFCVLFVYMPSYFTCLLALVPFISYLSTCLCAFVFYLPTCLSAYVFFAFYVSTRLRAFVFYVSTYLWVLHARVFLLNYVPLLDNVPSKDKKLGPNLKNSIAIPKFR